MSRKCALRAHMAAKVLSCGKKHGIIPLVEEQCAVRYRLIRKPKKTFTLRVTPAGEVVVTAPVRAAKEEIEAFIARSERWIASRRAYWRRHALDLADGAVICICGRQYTITAGRAALKGKRLYLPREGREDALKEVLCRAARMRMYELLQTLCAQWGFAYSSLRITSARSRWGSCSAKGSIAFSFRTALLPDGCAMYLAAHELCHTRHMDHGPQFWREVESILPDYRTIRKELRKYAYLMGYL